MRTLLIGVLAATLVGCSYPFIAASQHGSMREPKRVRRSQQDGGQSADRTGASVIQDQFRRNKSQVYHRGEGARALDCRRP